MEKDDIKICKDREELKKFIKTNIVIHSHNKEEDGSYLVLFYPKDK